MGTNEEVTLTDMEDRAFRYFSIAAALLTVLSTTCGVICVTTVQTSIPSYHMRLLVTFAAYPLMWVVWWGWIEAVLFVGDVFFRKPMMMPAKEVRAYMSGSIVCWTLAISIIVAAAILSLFCATVYETNDDMVDVIASGALCGFMLSVVVCIAMGVAYFEEGHRNRHPTQDADPRP